MNVRDVFFEEIYKLVKEGEDIVIVSCDLGAPSLDVFRKDFPHRFINVGIAEQNLILVASGLALAGKKVIAWGLNPFPVTRAYDQVRNMMESLKIPVTVVGWNAGSCIAESGFDHMPIEDYAIMRTLGNVRIINPSDFEMASKAADVVALQECPTYIRLDKGIDSTLYEGENIDFKKGYMIRGNKNAEFCIISCGYFASQLQYVLNDINNDNIKLVDCFSTPFDEHDIVEEINGAKVIVSVEDNLLNGGLGTYILEILSDNDLFIPVKRLGLQYSNLFDDLYINRSYWHNKLGLDIDGLKKSITLAYKKYCG